MTKEITNFRVQAMMSEIQMAELIKHYGNSANVVHAMDAIIVNYLNLKEFNCSSPSTDCPDCGAPFGDDTECQYCGWDPSTHVG